jgi:hypothetical protein
MLSNDTVAHELPEDLRPHAARLSFDSTVSRQLVHRDFIDHVLVTDVLRLEEKRFICGARIPQSHSYFNEGGGHSVCTGILLGAEMGRQAGIAISHQFLGVSTASSYILRHMSCAMERPGPCLVTCSKLANIVMEIRLRDCSYRRTGQLTGLIMECVSYQSGERMLHAAGEWIFVPQKVYQKLRSQAPDGYESSGPQQRPERIDPGAVGRSRPENIVISPLSETAAGVIETNLIVDPDHPYFFEHKLDHVSGMLLLEGCNQIGTVVAGNRCGWAPRDVIFKQFGARFHHFAELKTPVKLEARLKSAWRPPHGSCALAIDVEAKQGGIPLAQFSIGMATAAAFEATTDVHQVRAAAGSGR